MDLICPQCHQNHIRKVSGIYKEQGRMPPPEEPEYERMLPANVNVMRIPILHLLGHLVGYPMAIGVIFLSMFLLCGTVGIGSTFGGGAGVGLFILGGSLITMWTVRKSRARLASRHAFIDEEYPRWQRAYQKWDRSYYCQVCDKVSVLNSQGLLVAEKEER